MHMHRGGLNNRHPSTHSSSPVLNMGLINKLWLNIVRVWWKAVTNNMEWSRLQKYVICRHKNPDFRLNVKLTQLQVVVSAVPNPFSHRGNFLFRDPIKIWYRPRYWYSWMAGLFLSTRFQTRKFQKATTQVSTLKLNGECVWALEI